MKFGGALSAEQLAWLRCELGQAAQQGKQALVFCHLAVHPDSTPPAALLWNYTELMAVVAESGCVAAVFSGHAHQAIIPVHTCHACTQAVLQISVINRQDRPCTACGPDTHASRLSHRLSVWAVHSRPCWAPRQAGACSSMQAEPGY